MNKVIFSIVFCTFFQFQAFSQELPEDFYETALDFTIDRPIGLKFDHSGNALIFAKAGLIYALNADGQLQETPVLDISEEVTDWSDHGLVSIALDPNYETNGFIYLFYTVDRHHMLYYGTPEYDSSIDIYNQASMGRIARYTINYNQEEIVADESSRKVIFGKEIGEGNPILMGSHGVGTLAFGGDGSLLFTCGEGGSYTEFDIGNATDTFHEQAMDDGTIEEYENIGAFRSMLRTNLSGKVLRINPETGEGIANNPYYDPSAPNSKQSKIWVNGLRNPYKIISIPNTSEHTDAGDLPGKFFVGDVGSALWEELNLVDKSGDWFGWPKHEGLGRHWAFTPAVLNNPEMPNPNFTNGCGPEFFTFDDFIRTENRDEIYEPAYPCAQNGSPSEYELFIHRRPIMSYSNDLWNPPAKTLFPAYDNEGNAISISIDSMENVVKGQAIEGGSAMPGAICDSELFPEEYLGDLFLIDYHGWINAITVEDDQVTEIKKFAKLEKGITDIQFNPVNGKLYYVHIINGTVVEISYGGIRPPIAQIDVDQFYGVSPLTVQFNGAGSQSFDESTLSYQWEFGDGETSADENPSYTYDVGSEMRSFQANLIVSDTSGNTDRVTKTIYLNNTPPLVNISSISEGETYSQATVNNFDLEAEVIDAESKDEDLNYSWQVNLHHSEHVHLGPIDNDHQTYALIDPTGCSLESFHYEIQLTVEDELGLRGADTVSIFPYCGDEFSKFMDFNAYYVEEGIECSFEVTIEDNVEYYVIERTVDFVFQEIGTIPADGSSSYNFIDRDPLEGVNKYRIRAMNTNKDRHYSIVRTLNYHSEFGFTVGPNPVTDLMYISISKPLTKAVDFRVFDLTGRLVHQINQNFDNQNVTDFSVDLKHIPSGVYIYRLSVNGEVSSSKFSKF